MMLKMVNTTFDNVATEYTHLLQQIYPASDKSGFTERNLTYRFCKTFERVWLKGNGDPCFSWMEFPLDKYKKNNGKRSSAPHLDSVIFVFSKDRTSVIYIEAKRITENNYNQKYKAIINDIKRMKENRNRVSVLGHILKTGNTKKVDEYICFLADVWIGNKRRSFEVPDWWKNTLPSSIGQSKKQKTFVKVIKKYKSSSYNILGLIEQL